MLASLAHAQRPRQFSRTTFMATHVLVISSEVKSFLVPFPVRPSPRVQAFDFAAHVQGLIDKTKMESIYGIGQLSTIHEQGRRDQEFFSKAKGVNKGYSEDDGQPGNFDENYSNFAMDGTPGIVSKLTQVEERALCNKFNEALAEYDSDELGEGYDCDEVLGNRPLEGDTLVETALADYLQEREDEVFMQRSRRYTEQKNGGSRLRRRAGR